MKHCYRTPLIMTWLGIAIAATASGVLHPQQTIKSGEPENWQPPWKDDQGQWQPPWIGRWEDVALAVGHASVLQGEPAFSSSMNYWQRGWLHTTKWSHIEPADLKQSLVFDGPATVLVEGDCLSDISIPDQGLVHILGDLNGKIRVGDHSEIVISGSVKAGGTIESTSIVHIFVGKDFDGRARDGGSSWWIGGTWRGHMQTGSPWTRLHVEGDFLGTVAPTEKAMLSIFVRGYMPSATLDKIADFEYTEFTASIGISERRGLHPDKSRVLSNSRWVVHKDLPPTKVTRD